MIGTRSGRTHYDRYGWQFDLGTFSRSEPRVVRLQKQLRVGPWYNALPTDFQSCCQLETVATEFSSQGLELDCALLAWGSDLLWAGDDWSIEFAGRNRPPLKDPLTVRKDVYRVLLTRGRDGTVVFVPPDSRMEATAERLAAAGFREL